jgi:hypothetical protein
MVLADPDGIYIRIGEVPAGGVADITMPEGDPEPDDPWLKPPSMYHPCRVGTARIAAADQVSSQTTVTEKLTVCWPGSSGTGAAIARGRGIHQRAVQCLSRSGPPLHPPQHLDRATAPRRKATSPPPGRIQRSRRRRLGSLAVAWRCRLRFHEGKRQHTRQALINAVNRLFVRSLTSVNRGGRGRYRTADRWCVKRQETVNPCADASNQCSSARFSCPGCVV